MSMLETSDGCIRRTDSFHTIDMNEIVIHAGGFQRTLVPGGNIDIDEPITLGPSDTIRLTAKEVAYCPRLTAPRVRRKRLKKKVSRNIDYMWYEVKEGV